MIRFILAVLLGIMVLFLLINGYYLKIERDSAKKLGTKEEEDNNEHS